MGIWGGALPVETAVVPRPWGTEPGQCMEQ